MAAPFQGKKLYGVLAGAQITSNAQSRRSLLKLAAKQEIPILIPTGQGWQIGDGCYHSQHFPRPISSPPTTQALATRVPTRLPRSRQMPLVCRAATAQHQLGNTRRHHLPQRPSAATSAAIF